MTISKRPRFSVAAWLVATLIAASGCSFNFVRGPTADARAHPADEPPCTRSVAAPVIDTAIAAAAAVTAGFVIRDLASPCPRPDFFGFVCGTRRGAATAVLVPTAITGGIFTASAYHGYKQTRACRDLYPAVPAAPPAARSEDPIAKAIAAVAAARDPVPFRITAPPDGPPADGSLAR